MGKLKLGVVCSIGLSGCLRVSLMVRLMVMLVLMRCL